MEATDRAQDCPGDRAARVVFRLPSARGPCGESVWIRRAFSDIADPTIQAEALKGITPIGSYGSDFIEDPNGSRELIADELEQLATFVSHI